MKISRCIMALGLLIGMSTGATAQEQPVSFVELYTSQGCSSCPAADALLTELNRRSDIIALSMHVDYWDYLGWKDQFALPGTASRQRAYRQALPARSVYTPQMVINGRIDVVGNRRRQVIDALAENKVPLIADGQLGETSLTLNPVDPTPARYTLWAFGYDDKGTANIKRGELAGHTLNYSNVVREWRSLGEWDGATPAEVQLPTLAGDSGMIIAIQKETLGPVVALARFTRP